MRGSLTWVERRLLKMIKERGERCRGMTPMGVLKERDAPGRSAWLKDYKGGRSNTVMFN